jgi:hypothetical protein
LGLVWEISEHAADANKTFGVEAVVGVGNQEISPLIISVLH